LRNRYAFTGSDSAGMHASRRTVIVILVCIRREIAAKVRYLFDYESEKD
jgi:hypothetical protein